MQTIRTGTGMIVTACKLDVVRRGLVLPALGFMLLGSGASLRAQAAAPERDDERQYLVEHPECSLFGPQRESFLAAQKENYRLSALTARVTNLLPAAASGRRAMAASGAQADPAAGQTSNLIDQYLFQAMQDAGVAPADTTNDFEFIRRVTLDLTGRIPTAEAVMRFVADISPNKRSSLIDNLLNQPEWVDKWTMYFGDLLKNTANKQSMGTILNPEGRNAFYKWIKDSLGKNKPYNQIAQEIISARGTNTWDPQQGAANWIVLGRVTGGPVQDTQDQLTANVAETFLGLANLNCLLCHNGRGHLDTLNLWGAQTTRYQAWQMAAFLAHTPVATVVRPDPMKPNSYYWTVADTMRGDYQLGSTSGNRPARTPVGNERTVAPSYIFTGDTAANGENYRDALARFVTSDFQFARASVNYIWQQFFGRGIVEPANQFDLARLDPANPPPDPWTLQPSNPALLTALSQYFIDSGYDLKSLMRLIANSQAYQLSARYKGDWNPQNEALFARKLVRRLWSEEIHDSITQSSGVPASYKFYLGQDPNDVPGGTVVLNWAMQLPETSSRSLGGVSSNAFLDAFLRGNRDDTPRRGEGSLSQALNLMNDNFVMSRIRTANAGPNGLINKSLALTNEQLVSTLYINVLSRYPTDAEKSAAYQALQTGDRRQKAEDLLWSLYNKVDFIFNY